MSETTETPALRSFDRVAHCYDETRGLPPEAETLVADAIFAALADVAQAPHLLEVGIGTGRMAVPLAQRGVRVTGIDISPKMLAVLREKRRDVGVMLAEASRPPLREGVFAGALFVHILHLVPDRMATLRATVPLLQDGGALMMGGDDRAPNAHQEAGILLRQAVIDIAGVDLGDPTVDLEREAFERVAVEAGMEIERRQIASWPDPFQGARAIGHLERREISSSWRIPEAAFPALIERQRQDFEEHFGDLEREIPVERTFSLAVARRAS